MPSPLALREQNVACCASVSEGTPACADSPHDSSAHTASSAHNTSSHNTSAHNTEALARIFKTLGDPTRLRLLALIASSDGGEACLCDLTAPVNLSQPTVSHHMRLLVEAGLASREQRGRWAYYRVIPGALAHAAGALARLA